MFDKLIVTVWSAPNYCYRYALRLYGIPFTQLDILTSFHYAFIFNQLRKCCFDSGTGRGSTAGIQSIQSCACSMFASHSSSSMVLIIFVECPLHTSEAATTRLLPLTSSVYLSGLYELLFSGIHHLSTVKPSYSPDLSHHLFVISQAGSQLSISLPHLCI